MNIDCSIVLNNRIAIFGGSFNPIHNGHLAIAQAAIEQNLADEVWLMVSPQNPLKEQSDLADENLRFAMVEKAVKEIEGIEACDIEFQLPRPSYTWKTLEALRKHFPFLEFSLLIGGDNLAVFDRWANGEEILRHHRLIVYPREGSPIDAATLPPQVQLLEAPLFPFSSTDIRKALRAREDTSAMIPAAILDDCIRIYSDK